MINPINPVLAINVLSAPSNQTFELANTPIPNKLNICELSCRLVNKLKNLVDILSSFDKLKLKALSKRGSSIIFISDDVMLKNITIINIDNKTNTIMLMNRLTVSFDIKSQIKPKNKIIVPLLEAVINVEKIETSIDR